jgi:hypothetical protein
VLLSYLCEESRSAGVNTTHPFLPELFAGMLYIVVSAYKGFKTSLEVLAHVIPMFWAYV